MLRTLGDIYEYTNEKLLGGELSDISDVIEFLEECQNVICDKDPLEAPIHYVELTTNSITLPSDFQCLRKIVIDDAEVQPQEMWGGSLTLPSEYSTGEAKMYYYRKPTALNPDDLTQEPDIDQRYFPAMAKYAAQMYYLTDDDVEVSSQWKNSFFDSLAVFNKKTQNKQSNFKNLW